MYIYSYSRIYRLVNIYTCTCVCMYVCIVWKCICVRHVYKNALKTLSYTPFYVLFMIMTPWMPGVSLLICDRHLCEQKNYARLLINLVEILSNRHGSVNSALVCVEWSNTFYEYIRNI